MDQSPIIRDASSTGHSCFLGPGIQHLYPESAMIDRPGGTRSMKQCSHFHRVSLPWHPLPLPLDRSLICIYPDFTGPNHNHRILSTVARAVLSFPSRRS